MEKYVVLDIESPNSYFSSVSAIAIVIIENNKIVDKIYSLINPEEDFEDEIIDLTGITPEMVKDKPKFNEFWPEIKDLLIDNVIIGHNISYDLTVISNSLKHYNIDAPNFNYICTLKLSRQRLNFVSNSLQDIMDELDYDYDAHQALADAEAANYLFNYINDIKPITFLNQEIFYNKSSIEDMNEELYPNINKLYGYLLEFKYKEDITENQLQLFREWLNDNKEYSKYFMFNNIINKLSTILSKKTLTIQDKRSISTIATSITKSSKYSREEINKQILDGILKMLICDEKINNNEVIFLEKWLTYNTLPEKVNVNKIIESIK